MHTPQYTQYSHYSIQQCSITSENIPRATENGDGYDEVFSERELQDLTTALIPNLLLKDNMRVGGCYEDIRPALTVNIIKRLVPINHVLGT